MTDDKRARILDALHFCLQEKPFDRTSIKDIARKAGVNHGLLHYYFKSKEDILVHYIDHVIEHYRTQFTQWLGGRDASQDATLLFDLFDFMNERITLNRPLSRVFIEIWEISVYNPVVRGKVQSAYREWMAVLTEIIGRAADRESAERTSMAVVAFVEGMALFSVLLDPDGPEFSAVLSGFQRRITGM